MSAPIGRILMARGRDATDVALSTSFGATRLASASFNVHTDELAVTASSLSEKLAFP